MAVGIMKDSIRSRAALALLGALHALCFAQLTGKSTMPTLAIHQARDVSLYICKTSVRVFTYQGVACHSS